MNPGREVFVHLNDVRLFYLAAGAALAVFCWGVWLKIREWRAAAPDRQRGSALQGLKQALADGFLGRRILKDDFWAGAGHLALAWGFIVLFLGTLGLGVDHYLIPWLQGSAYQVFSFVLDLAGVMLLAGVAFGLIRRLSGRPERLERRGEDVLILVLLAAAGASGFLVEGSRLALQPERPESFAFVGQALAAWLQVGQAAYEGLWWAHALICLGLIAWLPFTKLIHVLAGPIQLYLEAQPLRPMAGEAALISGQSEVISFWACTRCGRCEAVCPAWLAGEGFSPRAFIAEIKAGRAPTGVWHCASCRACFEACPLLIGPPETVFKVRGRIIESGVDVPAEAIEALESLQKHANPWGAPRRRRSAWTQGRAVKVLGKSASKAEVLYFVGCTAAIETRAQGLARALAGILEALEVDFAVLGDQEPCCGDAARQWGEVGLYELLWAQAAEALAQAPVKEVVCSSPHCLHAFCSAHPLTAAALKVDLPVPAVTHYSVFLDRLAAQGRLKPGPVDLGRVTYHDPCYLGRWQGVFEPPRRLLRSIPGLEMVEMAHHHAKSLCCGGGGGRMWQDFAAPQKPSERRLKEAAAAGAEAVVTACPFCLIMLEDGLKTSGLEGRLKVIDLAELIHSSLSA